jgi:hypothetical protein
VGHRQTRREVKQANRSTHYARFFNSLAIALKTSVPSTTSSRRFLL